MRLTRPSAGYFEFSLEPEDKKSDDAWEFIEEVKKTVPSLDRKYSSEANIWTIKERWYAVIRKMRDDYFGLPNHDLFEEDDV